MKPGWLKDAINDLADKWQIPTLVVALAVMGSAIFLLVDRTQKESATELVDLCQQFLDRERYRDSILLSLEMLKQEELDVEHRARLHGIIARVLYAVEQHQADHNARHLKLIDIHLRESKGEQAFAPGENLIMARTQRWSGHYKTALEFYRWAIEGGVADRVKVIRETLEMMPKIEGYDRGLYVKLLDTMLKEPSLSGSDLVWAASHKSEMLFNQQRFSEAVSLIDSVLPKIAAQDDRRELEYTQAMGQFLQGQIEPAERSLRHMLDGLPVGDLEGRVNLLLGQICLNEMRPDEALSFFANVILRHAHSELEVSATLGSAEAMTMVHRYGSAQKTYEHAFEVLKEVGPNQLIDRDMIVDSIRTQAKMLAQDGNLDEALAFGELEHRYMSQEQDDPARHELLKRLGEWYSRKGRQEAGRLARVGTAEYSTEVRQAMQTNYTRAGAMFLELAGAKGLSDTDSADALWLAALAYRDAGDASMAGQLFARFVNDWPANIHLPQALFNLAQSYQQSGRPLRAIEYYQRLVNEFPRTPVGLGSLVPMAQCYMMIGPESYGKAETILLQIVDDSANQSVLTPQSKEFRSALFLLGKLYYFQGDYEKCVGRLEEALQRYPDDVEVPETRFVIAQSYRKLASTFKDQVALTNDRTMKDQLMRNWKNNMVRATDLFMQAIQTLGSMGQTSRLEQTYLKLATIWYADCLFDQSRYSEAIAAYERVVDKYEKDAVALAAYLQIVNCYERQGRRGKIKAVLERMKWLVQQLPEAAFSGPSAMLSRQEWIEWIEWNYRSGMLQGNDESSMAEAVANGAR